MNQTAEMQITVLRTLQKTVVHRIAHKAEMLRIRMSRISPQISLRIVQETIIKKLLADRLYWTEYGIS